MSISENMSIGEKRRQAKEQKKKIYFSVDKGNEKIYFKYDGELESNGNVDCFFFKTKGQKEKVYLENLDYRTLLIEALNGRIPATEITADDYQNI